MSDQNTEEGVLLPHQKKLVVKQDQKQEEQEQDVSVLATCRFVNRYSGTTYVSIERRLGGKSGFRLIGKTGNSFHDEHVLSGDCYCWSINGAPDSDCSLTCSPGNTYPVGPNR